MEEEIQKEKSEIQYFEEEMFYLSKSVEEFSKKYPTVAGNLELSRERSGDPHVQQILESFAFLAGNLQKQIDENSYTLSQSLVEALYPNLALPVPSMSIAELRVNPGNTALIKPVIVPRDTELTYRAQYSNQLKFKTVFDTHLYPAEVTDIKLDDGNDFAFVMGRGKKLITIDIKLFAGYLKKETVQKIRFYINMRKIAANKLYDSIFRNCQEIYIYTDEKNYYPLGVESLLKVGFSEDENLKYTHKNTYDFSRIMQEYFLLPEKFLFFELDGINLDLIKKEFKILLVLEGGDYRLNIDKNSLKLRCTPIINIFPMTSEPVKTKLEKKQYILYTSYLKEKFLYFHSIRDVKFIDDAKKEKNIKPIKNFIYFKYDSDEFYYDIVKNRLEPNSFKINLYNNNNLVFIDKMTLYADIYVTNGYFCEKMNVGDQLKSDGEKNIESADILRPFTYYFENNATSEYYWSVLSHLYSEKIAFHDENEFLNDLKAIIRTKTTQNLGKDNVKHILDNILNIVESIESSKITPKSFKITETRNYFFVRGKEIKLTLNLNRILSESIVIMAESIFNILCNISEINECISLIIIEKSTQKVLYTCLPKNGKKRIF